MGTVKLGYEDFIATVDGGIRGFVEELHNLFTGHGCQIQVKEAKSGYVVSYLLGKKSVANYVFRKSGLIARIYGNHVVEYMEYLDTLPAGMVQAIEGGMDCKRLLNPADCNPKCAMGYDFILGGKRQQKCRNSAFFFPVNKENAPYIKGFLERELTAAGEK